MISVVMPARNAAPFIREAIESVLSQTCRDWELIVCDNGSTDGTQAIVEGYASRDDRVRLVHHRFPTASQNCNAGFPLARFPWIAQLDADDVAEPARFERQLKAAEADPNVVLWGSYAQLINRAGRPLRIAADGPTSDAELDRMRAGNRFILIQSATIIYRRDALLACGGYDMRFETAEDLDLLYKMLEHGSVRTIPEVLSRYRLHPASNTARRAAHQERLIRYVLLRDRCRLEGRPVPSLEEFLARLDARPARERLADWMIGKSTQLYRDAVLHHADGKPLAAAGCFLASAALRPKEALGRVYRGVNRRRSAYRRIQGEA